MQGHLIINHHITLRKDDNMSILNLFSLEGKNAIVIGACGGLGKGIATGLAEAGASVFVAGRKKEKCGFFHSRRYWRNRLWPPGGYNHSRQH